MFTAVVLATLMQSPADGPSVAESQPIEVAAWARHRTDHPFWDLPNLALFSGVAASRAFDYFSTRKFRDKHLKEWLLDDKTVDNRRLFAAIEIAGTLVSVGASYLLHRTGYHRLERWASIVHITFATAGGIWNCTLPNGL